MALASPPRLVEARSPAGRSGGCFRAIQSARGRAQQQEPRRGARAAGAEPQPIGAGLLTTAAVGGSWASRRVRNRGALAVLCASRDGAEADGSSEGKGNDDSLPSDEELRVSFNMRLPREVAIPREAAFRAEQTLKSADEKIAKLGINLDAAAAKSAELSRILPELGVGPPVAVVGLVGGEPLAEALAAMLPESQTRFLALDGIADLSEEQVQEMLQGSVAIAVCPGADPQASVQDLAMLLRGLPDSVLRVVLLAATPDDAEDGKDDNPLSFLDAMAFGSRRKVSAATEGLENAITMAARQRQDNALLGPPLSVTFVRAKMGGTSDPPRVLAKLPATVGEATKGLRSMYIGGLGSMSAAQSEEMAGGSVACPGAVASALTFVLQRGVNVSEFNVMGCGGREDSEDWDEIMLPLVGPEIWRLEVPEPDRARNWIRAWVDFNFCRGAKQQGTAMRRAGLRTPVEVRDTPLGVCLKFMPADSRKAGVGFDGLSEGGLEILVDNAKAEIPGRLRVRRCAYLVGKQPRETSERTILSRLKKDWEMAESCR